MSKKKKEELVFIWTKKYKCLENIGLNFNAEHRFKFDYEKRELQYTQNLDAVKDFFYLDKYDKDTLNTHINNVTAIVGNNGVGKSTVIEMIKKYFNKMDKESIIVLWDGEKMKVFYNYLNLNTFIGSNYSHYKLKKNYEKLRIVTKDEYIRLFSLTEDGYLKNNLIFEKSGESDYVKIPEIVSLDTIIISYSNIFDVNNYYNYMYNQQEDISLMYLINKYKKENVGLWTKSRSDDPIIIFGHEEFLNQINFPYVFVSFMKLDYIYKYTQDTLTSETINNTRAQIEARKLLDLLNNFISKIQEYINEEENLSSSFNLTVRFVNSMYTHLIYMILSRARKLNVESRIKCFNKLRILIDDGLYKKINGINILEIFDDFLSGILNEQMNLALTKSEIHSYRSMVKYWQHFISETNFESLKYENDMFMLEIRNKFKSYNNLYEFYNVYKETAILFNYLEFSWPLSSGENTMLGFLSRLYVVFKKKQVMNKNIILLIDEGDVTLHPEWQQRYINILLEFLKEKLISCNVQIILTTHSPILLSDIPNEDIIFLKKDDGITEVYTNEKETFGANIYDLYRNGFFLDSNNYGILGDFATKKIGEVEDTLLAVYKEIQIMEKDSYKEAEESVNNIDELFKEKYLIEKTENIRNEKINRIKEKYIEKLVSCKKVIDIVGEQFIKKTLLERYYYIYEIFNIDKKSANKELIEIKNKFEELSKKDQDELIKYIISERSK